MWANSVTVGDVVKYNENIQSGVTVDFVSEMEASFSESSASASDNSSTVNASKALFVYYTSTTSATGSYTSLYHCCSASKPAIVVDNGTYKYLLKGTYYSGYSQYGSMAGKYCVFATYSLTSVSNCSSKLTSSILYVSSVGSRRGSYWRYSTSKYFWSRMYSATKYTLSSTRTVKPTKYKISSGYTFDETTGKYTLTSPEVATYTSDYVGYYLCEDKVSTTCDTMYKIVTVDSYTITKADRYTSNITHENNTATYDVGDEIPMDNILTMQVWIPRYKYKVWNYNLNGTKASSPQEIEIEFEKGTTSSGEIECTDNIQGTSDGTVSGTEPTSSEICKIKNNNAECTDSLCNELTYTHPAFTFGDKELTGFWVGKYEVSSNTSCEPVDYSAIGEGCNLTSIRPLVKPNVTSWRGAMISVFENNMMAMNDSGNKYGFASTDDTHMIKNMEWGAIAYLSHSKYGINTEVVLNSNSHYITGCGPQASGSTSLGLTCNSYNTTLGKTASTTGNIYGVYDMSGVAFDYVMGNIVSPNGTTMMSGYANNTSYPNGHSGYRGILYYDGETSAGYGSYSGTYEYPENKYYDKYSFNTSSTTSGRSKLGDALKEVFTSSSYGWYSDHSRLAESNSPWFIRGDYSSYYELEGVFGSESWYGHASIDISSRLVISQ